MKGQIVEIEWMPLELRSYPAPTLRPENPYLSTVWYRSVYPAEEDYRVARLRYEAGKSNIVQACYAYKVARDQLLRAIGE